MKKRMELRMKLRIRFCLCLVAAALMISGIAAVFAYNGKSAVNKEAENGEEVGIPTEVVLAKTNAGGTSNERKTVLYAAKDALDADSVLEAGEDSIIEDGEKILLATYGKYTGAQVESVKVSYVSQTDYKIAYLKKSFTNTSTGGTIEVLNTANRCFSFLSKFVSIGPYAFAGANNANTSNASTVQTRINTYLKEISFESGSEMVSIGEYAFSNASVLAAFDGENATKLTTLGDCVFYNDRVLETIVLPGNITSVGANTFKTNNSSTKVVVPEGSTTDKLFQGSYVFNLPSNVYYTYSGVDPADNSLKKFSLTFSGSNYDAKVYADGNEIATYTSIAVGTKVKINLQPKTGYKFKSEPVSTITAATSGYACSANGSGYEIEFTMTKDATITFSTEIMQYTLKETVTDNFATCTTKVTVSGDERSINSNPFTKKYDYGTKLTLSFIPATHYYIESVTLDNVNKGNCTSLEITMDQDHEVTVSFLPDKYTLSTVYDSAKGRITGNEGSYTYGTQASLTIEPLVGYEISEILVNGSKVSVTSNLKLSLEKNTSVQVIFQKKLYTIDASGENVTVTNNVSGVFEYGTDVTLKFTPDEGYRITDVLVDEKSVGAVSTYLFSGLSADHAVEVRTERITYQITVNADEHAVVSNEPVTVTSGSSKSGSDGEETDADAISLKTVFYYGETPEFYFSAMDGYVITDILLDGASLGARESYCFPELRKDHTLTVLAEEVKQKDSAEGDGENAGSESGTSGNSTGGADGTEAGGGDAAGSGVSGGSTGTGDSSDGNGSSGEGSGGSGSGADGNTAGGSSNGSGETDSDNGGNTADNSSDGSIGENGNGETDSDNGGNTADNSSDGSIGGSVSGETGTGNGGTAAGGGTDGSVSGNGGTADTDGTGSGSLQDKLDNQYPDKTGYDVDDEGNAIDKTATVLKLELDSNGGLLKYDYLMYHMGAAFQLPVPIRDGYDFAGWYLGDKKVETTKAVLSQTDKLVACWTPAVFRITYDLKGGIFKNTSKVAYLYTITKSTSLVKPQRDGYVFGGWYLKDTDIKLKKIQKGWYYGGTLELEAKWYLKNGSSYTVTNKDASTGGKIVYDLAGGYFKDPGKVQEYYAFMTTTSLPKPARTGYVFEGWYIEGTDVRLTKISKNQYLGELKLVAAWSRSHYTITYCTNKGKGKQDKTTLAYDSSALISGSLMTRKGYIFTGWNTKANGTGISYQPGDEVKNLTLKTNIKLYAQWQKLF